MAWAATAALALLLARAGAAQDCSAAPAVACGDTVTGTLVGRASEIDAYPCSPDDFSGGDALHVLSLAGPRSLRITLTATSGDPRLLVLTACDPNACIRPVSNDVVLRNAVDPIVIVVDSAPGDEGGYELRVECLADDFTFCTGAPDGGGRVRHDPWLVGSGVWLVAEWLYHPSHTHDRALRVDGGRAIATRGGDCALPWLTASAWGAAQPGGPGVVVWRTAQAEVRETLSETTEVGCCGIRVDVTVRNLDVVPHSYEWRTYHDTAFGPGSPAGPCSSLSPTVDGGRIEVEGVSYLNEVDLLTLNADTCEGQVKMFSAETNLLHASYEMLAPHFPSDMEFLRWNNGNEPCSTWRGMVDGDMVIGPGDCSDNSLLFIWRFPDGAGQLAPGESATASYRIGWKCAWPCSLCDKPLLSTGGAADASPCADGIQLDWAAASFPAAGNGVYHVYRSTVSFADAMLQPRLTPSDGITDTTFPDVTTLPGVTYFHVVQAESTDLPGCGTGPRLGSTAELNLGPTVDVADLDGPSADVGNALRATGHTVDTVDFEWTLAPVPGPGESYVVLRSDARPDGSFIRQVSTPLQTWTDPAAPARFTPSHVWFYDVRIADGCGNLSLD